MKLSLLLGAVLHPRSLAFQFAQVVELRTANLRRPHDLDLLNRRGMQRKDPLDALTERSLPDREGRPRAPAVQANHDPFENLDAFFVALTHLYVHANGVA